MRLDYAVNGYWLSRKRDFSKYTISDYQLTFRRFAEFAGKERELEDITSDDVNAFLNYLVDDLGLSKKAVLNAWIALSSFWTWAEREVGVKHVMRGRIPQPNYRRPQIAPYTDDEVRSLLGACDLAAPWDGQRGKGVRSKRPTALRDRAIMLMFLDSGIRVGELVALTVGDYDMKRGQVLVLHGKGDKKRAVFVGESVRRAMWRYLATRGELAPDAPLFAGQNGKALDRCTVLRMISHAGKRAGVAGAGCHRFRHTFAINFLRNGGDALALQDLLGHERLDTVRIYVHLATVDLERAHSGASPADKWRL